jgi:uncharacterized membrane protein YdjX (TVP38/TMEM64 family)
VAQGEKAGWLSREPGLKAMILLRLSPLVPFGALNLVLGLLRVKFSHYLFATFAGIFFDVFLLCNLGHQISRHGQWAPISNVTLALSFLSVLGVPALVKSICRKKLGAASVANRN